MTRPASNQPDLEIDAYLEGTLTEAQAQPLEAWINTSSDNAAAFLRLVQTHQALTAIGKESRLAQQADTVEPDELDAVTLRALAKMEPQAEPLPHDLLDQPFSFDASSQSRKTQDASLTNALGDLRWAAGKFTLSLIRSPYGITGAIAALLAIALLVLAPWKDTTEPENTTPIAQNPSEPGPAAPAAPIAPPVVATLTDERDAAWDRRPGDDLYAGQRFTLTRGFAEITTVRGAIAIFEAPATIELLDNNAIRLHNGKLLGICETPSSKGFLVRTTQLDITDLGTRFGVELDETGDTLVDVFDGKVKVIASDGSDETRVLKQAESIAYDAAAESFVEPEADTTRASLFAALTSITHGIAKSSDNIRVMPTRPKTLDTNRFVSDTDIYVIPELSGLALPGDVRVNHVKPGRYDKFLPNNVGSHLIPAGTMVRSYVIHVDSTGPDDTTQAFDGELTFDGPIIGVITQTEDWASFNRLLPNSSIALATDSVVDQGDATLLEGADYLAADGRPITEFGDPDWIELEPNGFTLTFRFAVQEGADQVRVLVAEPSSNNPTATQSR